MHKTQTSYVKDACINFISISSKLRFNLKCHYRGLRSVSFPVHNKDTFRERKSLIQTDKIVFYSIISEIECPLQFRMKTIHLN